MKPLKIQVTYDITTIIFSLDIVETLQFLLFGGMEQAMQDNAEVGNSYSRLLLSRGHVIYSI